VRAGHPVFTSAAVMPVRDPTGTWHFRLGEVKRTGVAVAAGAEASPPVGSHFAITLSLFNQGRQYGKPSGARVGRMLIDCTVLAASPDGLCSGIAHVPDGFFTFSGSGPFNRAKVKRWAITGGIGPYSVDGQMIVRNTPSGSSATVRRGG
jgi:hypothetical protein